MRVTVPKEMSMFLKSIIEVKSAFNIDLRRSRGPYRFLYKKRLRVSLLPVDGKLSPQHAPPPPYFVILRVVRLLLNGMLVHSMPPSPVFRQA